MFPADLALTGSEFQGVYGYSESVMVAGHQVQGMTHWLSDWAILRGQFSICLLQTAHSLTKVRQEFFHDIICYISVWDV